MLKNGLNKMENVIKGKTEIEKVFIALEDIRDHYLAPSTDAFANWETVYRFVCICNDSFKNLDKELTSIEEETAKFGIEHNKMLSAKWKRDDITPRKHFWQRIFK